MVGYAAAGVGGALLAAVVAFAPSFLFIALGADRFNRLRTSPTPPAFLRGAGPAAIGAIIGSGVLLGLALSKAWQVLVLAGGAMLLFVARRGRVLALVLGACAGALAAVAGAPLPGERDLVDSKNRSTKPDASHVSMPAVASAGSGATRTAARPPVRRG